MDEKTNVMRILDQKKVKYTEYTYLNTDAVACNSRQNRQSLCIFSSRKQGIKP